MYRPDEDTWLESPFRSGVLSVDDAFRVLADRHRRLVVTSLLVGVGGVPVDDLVEDVMVHADVPGDDPADARAEIATELYHVHLPKLADADLVERDEGTVGANVTDLPVTWSTTSPGRPGIGAP